MENNIREPESTVMPSSNSGTISQDSSLPMQSKNTMSLFPASGQENQNSKEPSKEGSSSNNMKVESEESVKKTPLNNQENATEPVVNKQNASFPEENNSEQGNSESKIYKLGALANITLEVNGVDLKNRSITYMPEFDAFTDEKSQIAFSFCVDNSGSIINLQHNPDLIKNASNTMISIFQTKVRTIKFEPANMENYCGYMVFKIKKIK
jgi:hypothetical protein